MKSHVLPNGLTIKHANLLETIHLYQDIFVLNVYLQHGITLPEHSVVIDGGANIGLFSLFVLEKCPTATIHAFEPAPKTFALLKANLGPYRNMVLNNCGLGSATTQERFTFMPAATTASGYYDDEMISLMKQRMERAILADPHKSRRYKGELGKELLNRYLQENLRGETVMSEVRSLSSYIDEMNLSAIDLLKIDVECREREVLAGIRADQWPIIKQVVIEAHARLNDPMREVLSQLENRGFMIEAVPDEGLMTTMVYAKRVQ